MLDLFQNQLGSIPILDVGGVDNHGQDQPQGVNEQMPFAPIDMLGSIVSADPPFSVVFTDWLSRIAALGSSSRPSWRRTWPRKVSWIRPCPRGRTTQRGDQGQCPRSYSLPLPSHWSAKKRTGRKSQRGPQEGVPGVARETGQGTRGRTWTECFSRQCSQGSRSACPF